MSSDWAASALRWWQDAGVDVIVGETARNWLNPSPAAAVREAPTAYAPAPPTPDAEPAPATLAAFQAWWLASDSLPVAAPATARVAPSGNPQSGVMVMVDMPSSEGGLFSAEAGALFDRMMHAIQRDRDSLYLASLSPARTPTGRLESATAAALADIARRHVALVRPKALLLFGDACAKALLGAAVAHARGRWHDLETTAGRIRTLVTIRPEKLLTQPGLKKMAWEDLQMLREEVQP